MQKIGRDQAHFFREVDGAYEYLCCAHAVNDVHPRCWDGHNKRSMCSSCIHIFVVIYVHYFRLLSKTFDLWRNFLHHCQSRNTWPRLMNINFRSRFSAQWNTPFILALRPYALGWFSQYFPAASKRCRYSKTLSKLLHCWFTCSVNHVTVVTQLPQLLGAVVVGAGGGDV